MKGRDMADDPREAIAILRQSHDHLSGIVGSLDPGALTGGSFCSEWTVAQVLSHLGSGAEIALMNLEAARAGREPPERSEYEAVWARWNASSPQEMAGNCLTTDDAHISTFEKMSDGELSELTVPFFGGRILDARGAVLMRLSEHTVHTWDVEVTAKPEGGLQPAAVAELIDLMPERVGRLARGERPAASPVALAVTTAAPERSFRLAIGDEVELASSHEGAEGSLEIPAEAFIRLLYGRLDAAHTPPGTTASGRVSLDELRTAFPGF
jgi:uncharacterized protein (TIGR03083 family)